MTSRKRRNILVAEFGVLALAIALAVPAPALAVNASPGVTLNPSASNCAAGSRTIVPNQAARESGNPADLMPPGFSVDPKDPVLRDIAAHAAERKWVTSVDCTPPKGLEQAHMTSMNNVASQNWSGYAEVGIDSSHRRYTSVSMAWILPPQPGDYSGLSPIANTIWPGIGSGNSNSDPLIQAGSVSFNYEPASGTSL